MAKRADRPRIKLPGRGLPPLCADPANKFLPLWEWFEKAGRGDLSSRIREDWEERAAIMEYHGGMSRGEAEKTAHECIERKASGGRVGR